MSAMGGRRTFTRMSALGGKRAELKYAGRAMLLLAGVPQVADTAGCDVERGHSAARVVPKGHQSPECFEAIAIEG